MKLIYKTKILFKKKIQISRVRNVLTCTTGGGVGCRLFLVAGARIGSSCAARFGGASPIPAILSFSLFFFVHALFFLFFRRFLLFLAQPRSAFALGQSKKRNWTDPRDFLIRCQNLAINDLTRNF